MHLRRLSNRIRHTAPRQLLRRNRARNDHHASLRILIERRHRTLNVLLRSHDVREPAFVPLVVGHGAQIREVGEACPACVRDDDVETAEAREGFLDAARAVRHVATVAAEGEGFDGGTQGSAMWKGWVRWC
jgi:hypothetical protein